jgi:hypothetical protein
MDNSTYLTTIIQQNFITNSHSIIATVICDSFNIMILVWGLHLMYLGIEIVHPVFATLFCNLMSVLAVSIIEILLIPFLNEIRIETLVRSSSAFYALFHACTWLVMSFLRYVYIVHGNWVHKIFPEAKVLTFVSLSTIYCIYGVSMSVILPIFLGNGWPYLEVVEMDREPKIACMTALLACYVSIVSFSNIFFVLILHQRGPIGKNAVDILPFEPAIMEQRLVG